MNIEEGFIFVRGKDKKERWVPIEKETTKVIWRYT
jgi:site-specific recombinase XerD|tara:strand:+ start:222 stop:326 length:105 start_codon:yes stop_codon:yes gene_type:complete